MDLEVLYNKSGPKDFSNKNHFQQFPLTRLMPTAKHSSESNPRLFCLVINIYVDLMTTYHNEDNAKQKNNSTKKAKNLSRVTTEKLKRNSRNVRP